LRLHQPPSQRKASQLIFSGFQGITSRKAQRFQADILLFPSLKTTEAAAGALTVAGQWRTFTAFPSILTITEIG
jgi:hypothetical protein